MADSTLANEPITINDVKDLRSGLECTGILVNTMKVEGSKPSFWKHLGLSSSRTEVLFDSTYMMPFFDDYYIDQIKARTASTEPMLVQFKEQTFIKMAVRQRYFNDKLVKAKQEGVRQIIILGTGFDCRAVQFKEEGVKFYEVDSARVLSLKKNIYDKKGIDPSAVYLPMSYLDTNFIDALVKAGVDFAAPTLFIWEGNSMYIPINDQNRLWTSINTAFSRYSLVFDYLSTKFYNLQKTNELELNKDLLVAFISSYDNLNEFCQVNKVTLEEETNTADLIRLYGIHDSEPPDGYNFAYLTKASIQ